MAGPPGIKPRSYRPFRYSVYVQIPFFPVTEGREIKLGKSMNVEFRTNCIRNNYKYSSKQRENCPTNDHV
jgi:hypothetical protein